MDRYWQFLMKRPQFIAVLVMLGLLLLPVALWLDLRRISDHALHVQARSLNAMVSHIRRYYATNVVARVGSSKGKSRVLHNYYAVPGAIPIPATLSIELGEDISAMGDNIGFRFVSDFTFSSRAPHALDEFEKNAIRSFRKKDRTVKTISQVTGSVFDRRIRLAVPVVMGGACVRCHNRHPESPRKDWKIGDVRGIQTVSIAQSIGGNLRSFQFLIAYMMIAGSIGAAVTAMQWRQAQNFQKLNGELATTNSALESVSKKISKYLPPQISKSIFSGEKDVSISTERKKLTIFFSDIKDFTLASDQLQPEELTQLLNEYFTEMSAIASEHGATLDKFIGDGIMAFFGDPESKGIKEDARACVKMAIAMQRRLRELNEGWKKRGIEQPLEARMGINTGYCNVGNFGSADRVSYTIIGAEANLAARLESISEPSGIVMSYETYANVTDLVVVEKWPAITLKGIAREVVPYAVQNIFEDRPGTAGSSRYSRESAGVSIDIRFNNMDDAEARAAQSELEAALNALKRHQRDNKTE